MSRALRGKLYSSSYLVLENPRNGLLNYANLGIWVAGRQRCSSGWGMGVCARVSGDLCYFLRRRKDLLRGETCGRLLLSWLHPCIALRRGCYSLSWLRSCTTHCKKKKICFHRGFIGNLVPATQSWEDHSWSLACYSAWGSPGENTLARTFMLINKQTGVNVDHWS